MDKFEKLNWPRVKKMRTILAMIATSARANKSDQLLHIIEPLFSDLRKLGLNIWANEQPAGDHRPDGVGHVTQANPAGLVTDHRADADALGHLADRLAAKQKVREIEWRTPPHQDHITRFVADVRREHVEIYMTHFTARLCEMARAGEEA